MPVDSHTLASSYDAYYYAHGCGAPYERNERWLVFFGSIADRIVQDIQPAVVLDAGCAMGFLVETLRDRGVRAFGLDISEYAIQNVRPDIRAFCSVGSVSDVFPQQYDLIVCIEVFEHLTPREAERAIENICQHTEDVLFSSTPADYKEASHLNVQGPEYWAELFARHGFFRDIDYDASFITPWAVRYRKASGPFARVVAAYERRVWQLQQENSARRELGIEYHRELAAKEQALQKTSAQLAERETAIFALSAQMAQRARSLEPLAAQGTAAEQTIRKLTQQLTEKEMQTQALSAEVRDWQLRWDDLQKGFGWKTLETLRRWRLRLIPSSSRRQGILKSLFPKWQGATGQMIQIAEVSDRPPVRPHVASVAIIICVHNALSALQCCLESVTRHTSPPYSLILVDDGSEVPTRDYLAEFARSSKAVLVRNDQARGYARAANQGLKQSSADYTVLLNSDTIVTSGWLDRMIACAESNPRIGLVGPLSNTASWQSIPEIEFQGDWAANALPPGVTIDEMGGWVAKDSARLYPSMTFLNGFCLMIKRQVIDEIGFFDEENFGAGYGEEDDYALRARKAAWLLALADDTYIYHAQSRSYSDPVRKRLSEHAGVVLAQKHGQPIISEGVATARHSPVLEGIRARSRTMFTRQEYIRSGQSRFAGRRVLFVLPVPDPCGGGNVVIDEAIAMRQMGADVRIFNLEVNRESFLRAYPSLQVPAFYGKPEDLVELARDYDAIIATHNASVEWLAPISRRDSPPILGYYIQGFEPYAYEPGTQGFQIAWHSYDLFPSLVRFTKTEWTRNEVKRLIGVDPAVIGVSVNTDLFRPRPCFEAEDTSHPIRITAMVRPDTPYREPGLTMRVLQRASQHYGCAVEIVIFGTPADHPEFLELPRNFAWKLAGVLVQKQVAYLLSQADIFVDFSSHQAMGLTALEAMASGAAVIVPERGGAVSFAKNEVNGLVVNTSSADACWYALQRLIEDKTLRTRIQRNALVDVCEYFPERPAFNILNMLFAPKDSERREAI